MDSCKYTMFSSPLYLATNFIPQPLTKSCTLGFQAIYANGMEEMEVVNELCHITNRIPVFELITSRIQTQVIGRQRPEHPSRGI